MRRRNLFTFILMVAVFADTASGGTIYAADYGEIYKLSSSGVASAFATGTGDIDIGMAFNAAGDLFLSSRDNNALYEITPAGALSTFASVGSPYGLAVDAAGDVFTSSSSTGTIIEYSPSGVASTFATDAGGYAYSLAIDPLTGYLFEGGKNGNIYEYSPSGVVTTVLTGAGDSFGITFDQSGDVYAGSWNDDILKITPSGSVSTFATLPNTILPTGLAYDYVTNTLYMAEVKYGISSPGAQVVDAFNASGTESVFATGLDQPFGLADYESLPAGSPTPEPGTFFLAGGVGLLLLTFRR